MGIRTQTPEKSAAGLIMRYRLFFVDARPREGQSIDLSKLMSVAFDSKDAAMERALEEAFPELVTAVANLPAETLALDGELLVQDETGAPQFERLCKRALGRRFRTVTAAAIENPAAIFAFDILYLDGRDCRELPLLERKAILTEQVCDAKRIKCAQHIEERGEELFAEVKRLELEGMVAKEASSAYAAGRSRQWLKIKTAAGRAREAKRMEHRRR
jgi:ATP-dependent DNA ligase